MTFIFPGSAAGFRPAVLIVLLLLLSYGCALDPAGRLAAAHGRGRACGQVAAAALETAAARNRESLYAAPVDLFGREERGWAIYAPAIENQIGSLCPADTPGFAEALARWSLAGGGSGDGVMTPGLLARFKADWQARRPFVRLRAAGACPPPPPASELRAAPPGLGRDDGAVWARRDALAAWARLVRDARRAEPGLAADPGLLRIFSAFRSPAYDDARCARDNNCQGVVRAACSAHRTGLALDVVLDVAPGQAADSSADANRLAMARGLAYRWLVANAARYGFVNYVFEPWHWEWTGARP